ncbi:hypothetical protein BH11PSE4_BH11PSE4_32570 [soil metagenome]
MLLQLRLKGIGLSIDDFATGYSSLSVLAHMPFNEWKIDRPIHDDCLQDNDMWKIVRGSISLAHRFGMTAVAEGIEDIRTAEALAAIGYGIGQGYFPAPARSPSDFNDWCNARHLPAEQTSLRSRSMPPARFDGLKPSLTTAAAIPERVLATAIASATMNVELPMNDPFANIDRAIDDLLLNLGGMVLRLARLTTTDDEQQALSRSVAQFTTCALSSKDARVRALAAQLEAAALPHPAAAARPRLRLVVSR